MAAVEIKLKDVGDNDAIINLLLSLISIVSVTIYSSYKKANDLEEWGIEGKIINYIDNY